MKGCYLLTAVIFFNFSISAYAAEEQEDLYGKYKGMMQEGGKKISNDNTKGKASPAECRQLEQSITAINGMKKGIFESTADFTQRRNAEIAGFEKKVQQAVTAGDAAYQAGTLTMTAYDADQEVLQADLAWNKEVLALLPDLQEIDKGSVKIPRKEAKNNFAAKKTHPIFITVAWGSTAVRPAKVIMPGKGSKAWTINATVPPEMVSLSGGSFQMGCVSGQNCLGDEKPVHQVFLSPFSIGKYEVTFAEWDACVEAGGCSHSPKDNGPDQGQRAVNHVSWEDVQEYIRWLNATTGKKYRLPTEAEWEYAARAGSTTKYCFGNSDAELDDYAWYKKSANNIGEKHAHAVGRKKANVWGLHDMHGNVWEWCADWYDSDYYGSSPKNNPIGPSSGSDRVVRGGDWGNGSGGLRAAGRGKFTPDNRNGAVGFRLVLPVQQSR